MDEIGFLGFGAVRGQLLCGRHLGQPGCHLRMLTRADGGNGEHPAAAPRPPQRAHLNSPFHHCLIQRAAKQFCGCAVALLV